MKLGMVALVMMHLPLVICQPIRLKGPTEDSKQQYWYDELGMEVGDVNPDWSGFSQSQNENESLNQSKSGIALSNKSKDGKEFGSQSKEKKGFSKKSMNQQTVAKLSKLIGLRAEISKQRMGARRLCFTYRKKVVYNVCLGVCIQVEAVIPIRKCFS